MKALRLVTVDLGNTKAALRLWDLAAQGESPLPALRAHARLDTAAGLADLLRKWLESVGGAEYAALGSVADRGLTERVVDTLEGGCRGGVLAPPDPGLRLELERADTVGEDRLFAARGAVEFVRGCAIVVDAGTALTVDAVGWTPAGGVFLGGAIAPGPQLAADALAGGGSRLPAFEPLVGAPALGRDTTAALRAGVAASQRGAARELVEALRRDPTLLSLNGTDTAPTVVLTGGARDFLLEPTSCLPEPCIVRPDVVHEGLLSAWRSCVGGVA